MDSLVSHEDMVGLDTQLDEDSFTSKRDEDSISNINSSHSLGVNSKLSSLIPRANNGLLSLGATKNILNYSLRNVNSRHSHGANYVPNQSPSTDNNLPNHILSDIKNLPNNILGLEEAVQPDEETHFTIDAREEGLAPLDVLFMDDYDEAKPVSKDENGIHDPKQEGILAVKLIKAKELIKGELVSKSDPYAVIRHGSQKYTTKVVENSHKPEWNYDAQVTIPDQGDRAVTIELFDKDSNKVIEQGWYSLSGVTSGQVNTVL